MLLVDQLAQFADDSYVTGLGLSPDIWILNFCYTGLGSGLVTDSVVFRIFMNFMYYKCLQTLISVYCGWQTENNLGAPQL